MSRVVRVSYGLVGPHAGCRQELRTRFGEILSVARWNGPRREHARDLRAHDAGAHDITSSPSIRRNGQTVTPDVAANDVRGSTSQYRLKAQGKNGTQRRPHFLMNPNYANRVRVRFRGPRSRGLHFFVFLIRRVPAKRAMHTISTPPMPRIPFSTGSRNNLRVWRLVVIGSRRARKTRACRFPRQSRSLSHQSAVADPDSGDA